MPVGASSHVVGASAGSSATLRDGFSIAVHHAASRPLADDVSVGYLVLRKLQLSTRNELTRWAAERRLI
ncbi:MAG: hypothetical protein ACR2LJ_00565 [Acidimicrobiales bacterium]